MPARQDQTLQIFLIIFIFGFLVSAVVAYLGWKGYSDAEQRNAALTTQLNQKNEQVTTLQVENEDYREVMGFGRNDNASDVKTAVEADMKNFGAGVADEGSRNYRKVLETVAKERDDLAAREATLQQEKKELMNNLTAVEAAKEQQVVQFQQAMQKAEADAAAERNSFKEDRAALETNKKELMDTVEKQKTEFEAKLATYEKEKSELTEKITKLERAVANLIEQVPSDTESFEVADGRITWVNQRDGTVWINLGTADALRRQVTFSVYDADQHDAEKAAKKGSIEVTRLLGDHMAEARITNDDPTNPIMSGDSIYSQVWHRGKRLRFALTGVVDINGDGQSDMQLARELIELNGGVVDAYVTDDGELEGEITANTRYLVLGEFPESAASVGLQQHWQTMNREATSLGVETITLHEFLNQMGYRPQDRSVQLGAGASARDNPARMEDPTLLRGAVPRFRARTPYPQAPAAAESER